jgi:hypothetical protein
MAERPGENFGKRRLPPLPPAGPPLKRSNHVALLVMGTLAVGSGAYALMPSENCDPNQPVVVGKPSACESRSSSGSHSSSGWSSGRSYFAGTESSTGHSSGSSSTGTSSSDGGSSHVSRGGFGSIGSSFGAHFSGG